MQHKIFFAKKKKIGFFLVFKAVLASKYPLYFLTQACRKRTFDTLKKMSEKKNDIFQEFNKKASIFERIIRYI